MRRKSFARILVGQVMQEQRAHHHVEIRGNSSVNAFRQSKRWTLRRVPRVRGRTRCFRGLKSMPLDFELQSAPLRAATGDWHVAGAGGDIEHTRTDRFSLAGEFADRRQTIRALLLTKFNRRRPVKRRATARWRSPDRPFPPAQGMLGRKHEYRGRSRKITEDKRISAPC